MLDLRELLSGNTQEGTSLDSIYEVEDLLLLISDINKKIEFYKELRRHRTESIDSKVNSLTQKGTVLREIILNTMKSLAPDEKTVHFPSVGKVSRRRSKDAWVVDSPDDLSGFLDQKKEKDGVVKISESFDKRKLNALLDKYKSEGTIPPGVSIKEGNDALTVTLEKPDKDAKIEDRKYSSDIDLDALDSLEV